MYCSWIPDGLWGQWEGTPSAIPWVQGFAFTGLWRRSHLFTGINSKFESEEAITSSILSLIFWRYSWYFWYSLHCNSITVWDNFFNLSHARIWQNIWHIETDESGDPWTINVVSAVCPYCSAMAALLWFQQWESILLFERKNNELLWLGVSQVQGHLFVEELAETQRDRATVLLNSSPPRSSEESTGIVPGTPYSGRWRLCGLLTVGAGGASRVTGRDTFFSVWLSLWLLWIPRILPHWGTCLTGRAQRLAWVHAP